MVRGRHSKKFYADLNKLSIADTYFCEKRKKNKTLKGIYKAERIVAMKSKGRFTRYDFVVCVKLTTGLRHELFRVNQTYNSPTSVVYVTKNVVGF